MTKVGETIYPVLLDEQQMDIIIEMCDFVLPYFQNNPKAGELETIKSKLNRAYGVQDT